MDTETKNKAIAIIAAEITKQPANMIMDHGTLGNFLKVTKRQGEAQSMARYFVTRFLGKAIDDDAKNAQNELVKEISSAAVVISGK